MLIDRETSDVKARIYRNIKRDLNGKDVGASATGSVFL
jgi:hypothetical protein